MADIKKALRVTTLLFVNSVRRGYENRRKGLVKRIAAGDWQIRCCGYHLTKSIITGVKTTDNIIEMAGLRWIDCFTTPNAIIPQFAKLQGKTHKIHHRTLYGEILHGYIYILLNSTSFLRLLCRQNRNNDFSRVMQFCVRPLLRDLRSVGHGVTTLR